MGGRSVPEDPEFGLDARLAGAFGVPPQLREVAEPMPGGFELNAKATTAVAYGSGLNYELPYHTGNDR